MVQEDQHKINSKIRAEEVRVVDEQGEMLGVMPTSEALEKAKEAGFKVLKTVQRNDWVSFMFER